MLISANGFTWWSFGAKRSLGKKIPPRGGSAHEEGAQPRCTSLGPCCPARPKLGDPFSRGWGVQGKGARGWVRKGKRARGVGGGSMGGQRREHVAFLPSNLLHIHLILQNQRQRAQKKVRPTRFKTGWPDSRRTKTVLLPNHGQVSQRAVSGVPPNDFRPLPLK